MIRTKFMYAGKCIVCGKSKPWETAYETNDKGSRWGDGISKEGKCRTCDKVLT